MDNNENSRIYVEQSMVLELLAAMFRVVVHEELLPQNQRLLNDVPEHLTKWIESTRKGMSKNFQDELAVFFNYESFLGLSLIQEVWRHGKHRDISEFLQYLEEMPAKELILNFFQTGYGSERKLKGLEDIAEVKDFLEKSALPEVERWKLLYFSVDPEHGKKRFIKCIREFYDSHFKVNESFLKEVHKESTHYMLEQLKENPAKKVEKFIEFQYDQLCEDDKVFFVPSYFYNLSGLFSYSGDLNTLVYVYGVEKAKMELSDNKRDEKVMGAIKILSDENRVKILDILTKSPCYGYELSQKLGISSSTISHHLGLLTSVGAIKPVREENKVYYEVNKENIKEIIRGFEDILI